MLNIHYGEFNNKQSGGEIGLKRGFIQLSVTNQGN